MEKLFNWISILIGVAGGMITYVFGAFDAMLITLLVLMAVDYISGIIKGIYNKKLSSDIGWHGLLKKGATLCVVALAHMVQHLLGDTVGIRDIVIMFYVANEGLSILENVAEVSTVIPEQLREVLMQLREGKDNEHN